MSLEDPNRWIAWQNSIRGRTVPRTEPGQTKQADSSTFPDFLWVITAIARLYAQNNVLEMQQLDNAIKNSLGEGTTFQVSSMDAPSTTLSHKTANKAVHKVVKAVLKQTPPEVYHDNGTVDGDRGRRAAESLLMELRILGHPQIRAHPNIVNLLGIGWQYSGMSVRGPHPVPILEQATSDLADFQSLNPKIPYKTKCTISLDVARGLQALHDCGVVHCDIKPKNILIFEEGDSCTAKLTDFSLSILESDGNVSIGGHTPGYNAPEWEKSMTFSDARRTDTYSFGVLFAVVMVGYDVVQAFYDTNSDVMSDAKSREKALEAIKAENEFKPRLLTLLRNTDDSDVFATEDSLKTIALQQSVLECTLQFDPLLRDLDKAISLLEQGQAGWRRMVSSTTVSKTIEDDILSVPYQSMGRMSRILKKRVVNSLEYVAQNPDEDRRRSAAACYELCICHLTGFGVPVDNNTAASWLIEAGCQGEKFAKSMMYRILSHLGKLNILERHTLETWLCEAAGLGSWTALQGLEAMGSEHVEMAVTNHRRSLGFSVLENRADASYSGLQQNHETDENPAVWLHEDARLGNIQAFKPEHILERAPDSTISNLINQKDQNGDTPLLSACRSGQHEIVVMLIELGADITLKNDLGENCLHFLLCLQSTPANEFRSLITKMFVGGADWTAHAHDSSISGEFEQGLIIAGCPRTRAANFNDPSILDMLYSLIDEQRLRSAVDDKRESTLARRLIAFACRSHRHEVLDVLAKHRPEEFENKILQNNWLWNNGRKYSLAAFAINGCVANRTVASAELPEKFWRVLNHGAQSLHALEKTLMFLRERGVDFCNTSCGESRTALIFAIRSSNAEAVQILLRHFSNDDKFKPFGGLHRHPPWQEKPSPSWKEGLPNHREKMGLVVCIKEAICSGQLDIFTGLLRWNNYEALKMGDIIIIEKTRWYDAQKQHRDGRHYLPFHVFTDTKSYNSSPEGQEAKIAHMEFDEAVGWEADATAMLKDNQIYDALSLNHRTKFSLSPLALRGRTRLVDYIYRPYSDGTLNYSLLYMLFIASAEHRDLGFAEALLATKTECGMIEHYQWLPRNEVELASFAFAVETPLFIATFHQWRELVIFLLRNGADLRTKCVRNGLLKKTRDGNGTPLSTIIRTRGWESLKLLLESASEHLRNGIKPNIHDEMKVLISCSPTSWSPDAKKRTSIAACYEATESLISNLELLGTKRLVHQLNRFVTRATSQGKNANLRALLEYGCSPEGNWASLLAFTPTDHIRLHESWDHDCGSGCSFQDCHFYIKKFGGHRRGLLSSVETHLLLNFLALMLILGLIPATYYSFLLVNNWHIPYFVQTGKRVESSSSAASKFWISCGTWFSFFAYALPLVLGFAIPFILWWGRVVTNLYKWAYWKPHDEALAAALLFPFLRFAYARDLTGYKSGVKVPKRTVKRDWDLLHFLSIDLLVYIVSCGRLSRSDQTGAALQPAFGRRTATLTAISDAEPA